MSLDCPELAADTIKKLREQGFEPTLNHIATLIELARRVQEPEHRTDPWLSYAGIRAGNSEHVLRPLTIKAGMWFDYIVDHLHSQHYKTMATAYAMEFGHDRDIDFRLLYDVDVATKTLDDYAKNISCNTEEMQEAMLRCMDDDLEADRIQSNKTSGQPRSSVQDTIAQLVAITGRGEEVWLSSTFEFSIAVLTHSLMNSASMYGAGSQDSMGSDYQRKMFEYHAQAELIERELKGEKVSG